MNTHQKHQSLVSEFNESSQGIQRYKKYAIVFQVGTWSILGILKYLQVQHLYLIAAILFGLLLLTRIIDFKVRRRLDQNMTRITLEGLKLEKQIRDSFFQDSLRNFGLLRVMLQRSLFDLSALWFFGLAMFRLITEMYPDLSINRGILYPVVGLLGFFVSDLYYKPLKPLVSARQEALSN